MALLLELAGLGAVAVGGVLAVRKFAGRAWRANLVTFELRFARGLDAASVTAALTALGGLVAPRWSRTVAVRAIVLELRATEAGIGYRLTLPKRLAEIALPQLRAALPDLLAEEATDVERLRLDVAAEFKLNTLRRELRVVAPEHISTAVLASLQPLGQDEDVIVQWVLQPAAPIPPILRMQPTRDTKSGPSFVAAARELREKQSAPTFQAALRIGVRGRPGRAQQLLQRTAAALHTANAPGAHLERRRLPNGCVARAAARRSLPLVAYPMALNVRELTGLLAFPIGDSFLPGLSLGGSRQLVSVSEIPRRGRVVACTNGGLGKRPLAISVDDSLRHLHLIGPTGVGKSTLMLSLITQDMRSGYGVVVIDPKGDLVRDVLDRVPPGRTSDVIVLDPSDVSRPVGLNPLATANHDNGEVVVEELTDLFRQLYRAFWGPRTDDILRAALLTLVREPGMTLCEVPLLLTDEGFRRRLTGQLDDPVGLEPFWGWYEGLNDGERTAAIGPVLNKLRAFVVRRRIRYVVGQSRPKLDLDEVLAKRRILLVSLRPGLLGADSAELFGSLVVGQLWRAVQRRAVIPTEERCPVFAYIDEVQDYLRLPTNVADVLAQARGLGLSLTLAHQHLGQLPRELRHAVLANARSRIAFQLGNEDARALAPVFGSPVTASDLQQLASREVMVQLAVGNRVAPPATARTEQPPPPTGSRAEVLAASHEQYGIDANDVEAELRRRHVRTHTEGSIGRGRRRA